jgi:hypothetical protein
LDDTSPASAAATAATHSSALVPLFWVTVGRRAVRRA